MNETVKASLAGISFTFDLNAYNLLSEYMDTLEKGYADTPDAREIISDIEARIAEIILSQQNTEAIVTEKITRKIIDRMGYPDDMPVQNPEPLREFPRRLYRNPEGRKIGGVCSGLGTFFDVDPVWFRLGPFAPLLLLMVLSPTRLSFVCGPLGTLFGALFVLYFVLWFVVPLAKTPRHKLEMRGERITASSIERNISETFSDSSPGARESASVMVRLVSVTGRLLIFLIKATGLIVGFGFAISAIAFLVTILAIAFGWSDMDLSAVVLPAGNMPASVFLIMALLVVFLPIAVMGYVLFKAIFSSRISKTFVSIAMGIWLIVTVFTTITAIRNGDALDNIDLIEILDGDHRHHTERDNGYKVIRRVEVDGDGKETVIFNIEHTEADSTVKITPETENNGDNK